jgi:hypothetical protein
MKQKILLSCIFYFPFVALHAQQKTAYAITAGQKGQNDWCEVRVVDMSTGDEVQSIYKTAQDVKLFNARTGKPIAEAPAGNISQTENTARTSPSKASINSLNYDAISKARMNQPFATFSAACAYDKKHDRLYYTPMGINQLRYINLKSKQPAIYYFEDEPFGVLTSRHDVPNQVTRMVIASDGNGYALTNNGEHLLQFTTKKKPVIKDLGTLTDDAANEDASVHNMNGYGGDMIADAEGNLYLITARHAVFKISLSTRVASFQGFIMGLPRGYTTNGAVVDEGSLVIVSSSNSTQGYYRFDLNTLQAEKVSSGTVYNASDLANGNLAFEKKKKNQKGDAPIKPTDESGSLKDKPVINSEVAKNAISIFPNPVATGLVKISFGNQPRGKYNIQLVDISGKLVSEREVVVTSSLQVEEFRLPELVTKGSYMMRVTGISNQVNYTNKILVQ